MKKIDIGRFSEQFEKEYDFLYENEDRVAGFDEAVAWFDEMLSHDWFKKFVQEFCVFRHDLLTSDRECAAFAFALEALGVLG